MHDRRAGGYFLLEPCARPPERSRRCSPRQCDGGHHEAEELREMLARFAPAPRVSVRREFHEAYREAWDIRRFTGSLDVGPLEHAFRRRGLAAEWIDDPAGWRTLQHRWLTGQDPDAPVTVATGTHRTVRSGRQLRGVAQSILSKNSR